MPMLNLVVHVMVAEILAVPAVMVWVKAIVIIVLAGEQDVHPVVARVDILLTVPIHIRRAVVVVARARVYVVIVRVAEVLAVRPAAVVVRYIVHHVRAQVILPMW